MRVKEDTGLIPLDIPKLLRLCIKAKEVSRSVEGKDIILVLGKKGVGKSTFVQFLGGSELRSILLDG